MTWRRRLARRLRRLARLIEGKPTVNMLEEAGLAYSAHRAAKAAQAYLSL